MLTHSGRAQTRIVEAAARCLIEIRQTRPCVHCITNTVAANTVANALLALGAEPSMTSSVDEVADFVKCANTLSINLGTLTPSLRDAIELAVACANDNGIPWLLDPVFVQRSPSRLAFAKMLMHHRVHVVRANSEEVACLQPDDQSIAQWLDSSGTVVAMTGAEDVVVDAERKVLIGNGHPLMSQVTATGCAASALITAFMAVESDSWLATSAALVTLGVAGELASVKTQLPGNFHVALIDALYQVSGEDVASNARLTLDAG